MEKTIITFWEINILTGYRLEKLKIWDKDRVDELVNFYKNKGLNVQIKKITEEIQFE